MTFNPYKGKAKAKAAFETKPNSLHGVLTCIKHAHPFPTHPHTQKFHESPAGFLPSLSPVFIQTVP